MRTLTLEDLREYVATLRTPRCKGDYPVWDRNVSGMHIQTGTCPCEHAAGHKSACGALPALRVPPKSLDELLQDIEARLHAATLPASKDVNVTGGD